MSAIPEADPHIAKNKQRIMLKGECCRFVERCTYAKPICHEVIPQLESYGDAHKVACHLL